MNQNNSHPFNTFILSDFSEEESGDLIQLIVPEEDEDFSKSGIPTDLPILPMKNTVLSTGVVIPITIGRQESIILVRRAYNGDRMIGVVAQRKNSAEEPAQDDIYNIGTVDKSINMLVRPD